MRFGQSGAERCRGCLIVTNLWCKSQKGGSFHWERRFSLCNTAVLWNFIVSLTGYIPTVKDFTGYLFSLYYCCFKCLRLAKPNVQLKCPNDINTEWALTEKFSSFYFTPENSIFLTLPLSPLFVFFHYSVCTAISDCNHPFHTSTFTLQSHKNTLLQLKIHIWSSFEIKSFYFPMKELQS